MLCRQRIIRQVFPSEPFLVVANIHGHIPSGVHIFLRTKWILYLLLKNLEWGREVSRTSLGCRVNWVGCIRNYGIEGHNFPYDSYLSSL